jgi:chromosomal replication initiation ATPase DnaA
VARQLTLDLGHRPALGRDDFLVTPSNAAAVALVDQWPDWLAQAAVIVGPKGSGKTHLLEVWRQISGAPKCSAVDITVSTIPVLLAQGYLAIENIDHETIEDVTLFHLLNHAHQTGAQMLFTAIQWLPQQITLPDLTTRLRTLPFATILQPDDALLRGVIVKHFSDRQIAVDEPLVSYLVTRMPRSLDTAQHIVATLDRLALERGSSMTRSFAARVLDELSNPDLD